MWKRGDVNSQGVVKAGSRMIGGQQPGEHPARMEHEAASCRGYIPRHPRDKKDSGPRFPEMPEQTERQSEMN